MITAILKRYGTAYCKISNINARELWKRNKYGICCELVDSTENPEAKY